MNQKNCPRCNGKGVIDQEDIQKWDKSGIWETGICNYCNGEKLVSIALINNVKTDDDYINATMSPTQRELYISDAKAYVELAELYHSNADQINVNLENFIKIGIKAKAIFVYDNENRKSIKPMLNEALFDSLSVELVEKYLSTLNQNYAQDITYVDKDIPTMGVRILLIIALAFVAIFLAIAINNPIFKTVICVLVARLSRYIYTWDFN
jgi:hypothetical protein